MTGPPPATAQVRVAVRSALGPLAGSRVAAAVSGGADSLALAAALAFERPGATCLVVDHGLQPGSAEVAGRAVAQCRGLGLDAAVLTGPHRARGQGSGGPEGRARDFRYALLEEAADRLGLEAVLLGHTRDDQAETVLLGLVRGSGARALAGMAEVRGLWRRPLLNVTRDVTRRACAEAGLVPWEDPHNLDRSFARVRVRHEILPALESGLGPGVVDGLARSAELLREDTDSLDLLARAELETLPAGADARPALEAARLLALTPAVRSRVLKAWAEQACGHAVTSVHVRAMRHLVENWSGQGAVSLPGSVAVARREGLLVAAAHAGG